MSRATGMFRSHPVVSWLVIAPAALLIVSLIPLGSDGRSNVGTGDQTVSQHGGTAGFTIKNTLIRQASPGSLSRINLTFTNPNAFPVVITHISVRIASLDAPNATRAHPCTTADFKVRHAGQQLRLTIPAKRTTTLRLLGVDARRWPQAQMIDRLVNQDGCKGAVVTLAYSADGSQKR